MLPEDTDLERDGNCSCHVHPYMRETSVTDDHQHLVMSVSGPMRGDGDAHIHRLRVRTTYVDGHWHWFDVMTGPAIEVPDDNHIHYFSGDTSIDDGHNHHVEGVTGVAPNDYLEDEDDEDDRPPVKEKIKTSKYTRK